VGFSKKALTVHKAVNGFLTLFRAEEGKGGEEEDRRSTSVSPLSIPVGSLTATSPIAIVGYGTNNTFFLLQHTTAGELPTSPSQQRTEE